MTFVKKVDGFITIKTDNMMLIQELMDRLELKIEDEVRQCDYVAARATINVFLALKKVKEEEDDFS